MTQTATFFDSYAHDFDAIYGNKNTFVNRLVNKYFRASMRLRYERTIAGCTPIVDKTVLDVGSGPGHFSVELARRGAEHVCGLDFAEGMIQIAKDRARAAGVEAKCEFIFGDFLNHPFSQRYDYTIVMGFMDYIENPRLVIERIIELTKTKAFISFPADGGLLAFQRKIRYRNRCPLYMYSERTLRDLFRGYRDVRAEIEPAARDYFVTLSK